MTEHDAQSDDNDRPADRGASAVEYALLIAGIAALIVVAVVALGPVVKNAFTGTCTAITGQATVVGTGNTCQ